MSDENLDNVIHLFAEQSERPQAAEPFTEGDWTRWTALWERVYRSHEQTLTNPTTANSLRAAAEVVNLFLEGSCATGSITKEQREKLVSLIVHTARVAADEFSG